MDGAPARKPRIYMMPFVRAHPEYVRIAEAPGMNPARTLITGVICGVRVEEIEEPTMQAIRYLDRLIDELAKGRPMEKILRGS